jgi:ParB family chromosome partitioning protein
MNKKSKLQMIQVEKLYPHPDNPRKVIGDVTELAESIKANGILQNLTVVPNNDDWDDKSDFTVVIGHRRLAAAKQAGLTELPCAVVEMTEKEQLSTMLTENMQRSDLTVYEEAKAVSSCLTSVIRSQRLPRKQDFPKAKSEEE